MTVSDLLKILANSPLIASVQASPNSPVEDPLVLLALARASIQQGVQVLRLQGSENIRVIRGQTGVPVIGLIKREYPGSEVYITPTLVEVDSLLELGCEIIALDGTDRSRPGAPLRVLVERIHAAGRLAMADCDDLASARHAVAAGCDLVGTTLSGYTERTSATPGPDLDLVRQATRELSVPIIGEGKLSEPWQARAALRAGATAVVVGGALNDPIKQTAAFAGALTARHQKVLAVDIGGTWLRAQGYSPAGKASPVERIALPTSRAARTDWILAQQNAQGAEAIGVSTGGTVDPATTIVWETKPLIPDHQDTSFRAELGPSTVALNDGLATAWAHSLHPDFAGRRVATLALGTGVGCGVVDRGRILMGPRGEYPRLNDAPTGLGASFEELLGGAALSPNPSAEQIEKANLAARLARDLIQTLFHPDEIVLAGGVAFAPWLDLDLPRSPFGPDAGLHGAASIAFFSPW